jgi:hypothetical protein
MCLGAKNDTWTIGDTVSLTVKYKKKTNKNTTLSDTFQKISRKIVERC